jgi:membrane protein YdbS with pleckstrin-like domain
VSDRQNEMSEVPRRFSPLRRAPRSTRVALYILGPLLWVVALMVVSLLVHEQDAIETGLLIAGTAFVVAVVLLVPQRILRVRGEKEHASTR